MIGKRFHERYLYKQSLLERLAARSMQVEEVTESDPVKYFLPNKEVLRLKAAVVYCECRQVFITYFRAFKNGVRLTVTFPHWEMRINTVALNGKSSNALLLLRDVSPNILAKDFSKIIVSVQTQLGVEA